MSKLVKLFEEKGTVMKTKKGRVFFGVDDPPTKMYLVKEGAVKIYRYTEDGKEVMLHIHGPNDLITISPIFRDMDHVVYAESLKDTEVYWIPLKEFRELISESPDVLRDVAAILSDNWDEVEDKIEAFVTHDSLGRLAYIILQLMKKYGDKSTGKNTLPFPLTHQEIANLTGMFRETISISMQELKKAGVISIDKHLISVEDKKGLEEFARTGKRAVL